MDTVLFKGVLQGSEITFGLLIKRKVLGFAKDGKYLVPRGKNKELITLPDEIKLSKIKKDSKETKKAVEFYLNNPELEKTGYGSYLIDFYIQELVKKEEIIGELDEEGKKFFEPLITRCLSSKYLKRASFHYDYFKESKVIARFALIDLELVFSTILRNIDDLVFKDQKPVQIFPLRYSTRAVTKEDLGKLSAIVAQKIEQWFVWRKTLRKAPYLAETAERAEILNNADVLTALQGGENFEAEEFSSISLNKHILYYMSMQFLFDEKQLFIKKYKKTPTFGYQDLLISVANIFTSFPLFANFNPLFSMITGGILEWIDKDLSFQALKGNRQLDPYNIIPNAFTFYLSLISSKTTNIKQRKFLLAKSLVKLLNERNIEEGLKWQKQSSLAMQGKDVKNEQIEFTKEDIAKKRKEIEEKLEKYTKSLRLRKEKQAELEEIVSSMGLIDIKFEDLKDKRDELLTIKQEYKKDLSDFQKDFILSMQIFEKDETILNLVAQLFMFTNKYILRGSSTALYGFSLLLWMITISYEGSLSWLSELPTEDGIEEGKIISLICTRYNTSLQGLEIKEHPLIESTAPTIIIQTAQNLNELLVAKDIDEEENHPFYRVLLANIHRVYPL
ncbi:MAG: hypothetical protein ACTSSF_13315 [Candidatus Heimdallarchaeaceae archaeon]